MNIHKQKSQSQMREKEKKEKKSLCTIWMWKKCVQKVCPKSVSKKCVQKVCPKSGSPNDNTLSISTITKTDILPSSGKMKWSTPFCITSSWICPTLYQKLHTILMSVVSRHDDGRIHARLHLKNKKVYRRWIDFYRCFLHGIIITRQSQISKKTLS